MTAVLDPRKEPRYALEAPVRYRADRGPYLQAALCDVSCSGLGLQMDRELAAGARVEVIYQHPRRGPARVDGETAYARRNGPAYRTGLQLHFENQLDQELYLELVRGLPGVCPDPPGLAKTLAQCEEYLQGRLSEQGLGRALEEASEGLALWWEDAAAPEIDALLSQVEQLLSSQAWTPAAVGSVIQALHELRSGRGERDLLFRSYVLPDSLELCRRECFSAVAGRLEAGTPAHRLAAYLRRLLSWTECQLQEYRQKVRPGSGGARDALNGYLLLSGLEAWLGSLQDLIRWCARPRDDEALSRLLLQLREANRKILWRERLLGGVAAS